MVWESVTDGNPSVDADELPTDKVTEPIEPTNAAPMQGLRGETLLNLVHYRSVKLTAVDLRELGIEMF